MVIAMILSVLNITAYSAETTPIDINFSTGAAGDPLPGTVTFTKNENIPDNKAFARHETLNGTMCAAITDTDPSDSVSLSAHLGEISEGVVSVDITAASSVLGINLCRLVSSDGTEVAKLRIKNTGEAVLITNGDDFNPIPTGDTFPKNTLVPIKFLFDFSSKTIKLSVGEGLAQSVFSAGNIADLSFDTTSAGYNDKIWISNISVYEGEEKTTGLNDSLPTLYLIGDSTGSPYTLSDYYKNGGNYSVIRNGFGMPFYKYFDTDKINLVNYAVSGISSKSFMNNDNNAAMRSTWKEGDYLIIAFGHNDEKDSDEARFTNASMGADGLDTEGQFAYSLYNNYIKPAQAAGVNVILATPIIRRSRVSDTLKGSDIHDLTDKGFGNYSQTIRDLASKLDLPCIDNTQMTYNEYIDLGRGPADGSSGYGAYHAQYSDTYMTTKEYLAEDGSLDENYRIDNTHLNSYGADTVAYFMAEAICGDVISAVYSDDSKDTLTSLTKYLKHYTDPRPFGRQDDDTYSETSEGFGIYLDTETTLHDSLGETFDVDVKVKDNKGISNITYTIDYDTDILELVSPEVKDAKGYIRSEGSADPSLTTADGTLATYTFKVIGGGDTDISLNVEHIDYDGTAYNKTEYSTGSLNIVCDFNPETAN